MNVVAVNGSPRGENASSREIIRIVQDLTSGDSRWHVLERMGNPHMESWESIREADVLLLAFPLYIDGIPARLVRFLGQYERFLRDRFAERNSERASVPEQRVAEQRVFAVGNCGFFEGAQNRWALEMIEHFCASTGLRWCGGVGIGTGEMVRALKNVPSEARVRKPITNALTALARVIDDPGGALTTNIYTQHALGWHLYKWLGQYGWRRQLRKNGLRWRDLHARPFAPV